MKQLIGKTTSDHLFKIKIQAVPISELIAEVLDGRNSHLTDGVQRALGRPPRDFADYARDAAASGVWNLGGAVS